MAFQLLKQSIFFINVNITKLYKYKVYAINFLLQCSYGLVFYINHKMIARI